MKVIGPLDGDPRTGFYVTVQRRVRGVLRTVPLLGPYPTHLEAQGRVADGRRLAIAVDSWAAFDAFGVTKVTEDDPADLPVGKLNRLLADATT